MNGRLYEPVLGRFLQTDPAVQDPFDLQNMNRYSYVLNNPLKFTDPSGYNWGPSSSQGIYQSVYYGPGTSYIAQYDGGGGGQDGTAPFEDHEGPGIFVGNNPASSANPAGPSKSFGVLKTGGAGNGSPGANPAAKQTINPYQVFKIQFSNSNSGASAPIVKNVSNNTAQSGGGGFDNFIDNTELSSDLWGPVGNGANNILKNRGRYMPPGEIYKVNKSITVRTSLFNVNTTSKVLNYARVGGKVLSAANILATGYEIGTDVMDGRYKSASARAAVYGIAAGAAFIPVVGWGVSIGIGVADYIWGDDFYNWVEKQ